MLHGKFIRRLRERRAMKRAASDKITCFEAFNEQSEQRRWELYKEAVAALAASDATLRNLVAAIEMILPKE